MQDRKGSVRPHLVHENQPLRLHLLGDHHPPGCSEPLVSFHRTHTPFFRLKPIRFNTRLMVEVLKDLPVALRKKRHLCRSVAAGRSSTASSSSFLVGSSAISGLPPPFFGASEAPWLASLM